MSKRIVRPNASGNTSPVKVEEMTIALESAAAHVSGMFSGISSAILPASSDKSDRKPKT